MSFARPRLPFAFLFIVFQLLNRSLLQLFAILNLSLPLARNPHGVSVSSFQRKFCRNFYCFGNVQCLHLFISSWSAIFLQSLNFGSDHDTCIDYLIFLLRFTKYVCCLLIDYQVVVRIVNNFFLSNVLCNHPKMICIKTL